jgi:hypothetical protein
MVFNTVFLDLSHIKTIKVRFLNGSLRHKDYLLLSGLLVWVVPYMALQLKKMPINQVFNVKALKRVALNLKLP